MMNPSIMDPIRRNKKKLKVENNADEEMPLVLGSSEEGSANWWDSLSMMIKGDPSSSELLDKINSPCKLSSKTFDYICSLVKEHMIGKGRLSFSNGKPMSLNNQVALALIWLGSGKSLMSVGNLFGAHHSTVSKVTWRFVEATGKKGLCHLQCWPCTEQEMTEIKRKFEKIQGRPNCCGSIDTTHITMKLTKSDPQAYAFVDRKGKHSITLQAIVDPDLKFRTLITGCPGKIIHSMVLKNSELFNRCQKGEWLNGSKIHITKEAELPEYIVGDSSYPLSPWLMTPYQHKELSKTESEFNKRVVATHAVAQRAFARLKEVWKILPGPVWRPDKLKLPHFILACCILHNILIEMKDGMLDELPTSHSHDPGYHPEICNSTTKAGSMLRDNLSIHLSDP